MNQLEQKIRAGRNRTLTVTEDEKSALIKRILQPDEGKLLSLEEITNKTILADLHKIVDLLPKSTADLIIIDPPYNLTKDFDGFTFKASSNVEYLQYLKTWFGKVVSILKPNGSLYICGDWKCTSALQQVIEEFMTVMNRITWQREKGRGALSNWKNGMEDVWFAVKDPKNYYFDVESVKLKRKVIAPYRENGKPKDWEETKEGNFRITYPSNFWDDLSIPYWSMPENTDHPTQKPEKLIAKLILASCPKDGFVFDPFLGSGTTSVVAKKLGRKYFGVEMNKEYALFTEKRLINAGTDKSIQGYVDNVFWERNTLNIQKKSIRVKANNKNTQTLFEQ